MTPVIEVTKLSKKFCRHLKYSLLYGAIDLVKGFMGMSYGADVLRKHEFWALKDISFKAYAGEAIGILGVNGSGKSTLMRLLVGIYPPDTGEIYVRGRVGALIALGAGFHPHMTGRENIFLNGSILGLKRDDIERRLSQIIDFAELGEFIDAPVSTYSSGMTVRLGFSIAVHCDTDILVVDEVLAVGDLAFALKCYERIVSYKSKGGTVLLVSHNNQLIRNFCDKAIIVEKGVLKASGDVQGVVDIYEKMLADKTTEVFKEEDASRLIARDPSFTVEGVEVISADGGTLKTNDPLTIRLKYVANREVKRPIAVVTIESLDGVVVVNNYSNYDSQNIPDLDGPGFIDFHMPRVSLKRGKYYISYSICEGEINNALSWGERVAIFSVFGGAVSYGIYNPFPTWTLNSNVTQSDSQRV